ncbi:MAG: branched-chain amino acid aminotransferase [Deltaproteobacteria bacterium]|nr:branched-chain amino acid aminotransferase [Deltaproteobacteria bacterium]
MRSRVWIDGRIVPAARARISVFDRGLLYGDAAFETIRVYDGRPFRWREHCRRLFATLARLSIPKPAADLRDALDHLLEACALREAAVRLTITRGVGEGLVPPPGLRPTVILMARPIPADLEEKRADGVAAIRLPFGRGRFGFTTGHKTTDYATAVRGRMLADRADAAEAIYVESDGTVSEATTSNVFAVRAGRLRTPPMEAGCLPGITRETVLGLARRAGFVVREKPLVAKELTSFDELFLTGSVIEILPVVRLDRRTIGTGRPGERTRALQDLYGRLVATTRKAALRARR